MGATITCHSINNGARKVRAFLGIILAFGLTGCSGAPEVAEDAIVLGEWRTQGGLRLSVASEGHYEVCFGSVCNGGEAEITLADHSANLIDFFDQEVVKNYTQSRGIQGSSKFRGSKFQVMTGKIPAEDEARICKGRPCVLLGSIMDRNPEAFIKVED